MFFAFRIHFAHKIFRKISRVVGRFYESDVLLAEVVENAFRVMAAGHDRP